MLRILICNDDGIKAPGIKALVEVAKDFGEVMVLAPDRGQSAQGHAITVATFLTITEEKYEFEGVEAYSCSGTPADCVKFALHELYEGKPDIVLSGINHGSNASINVIYSGTMAAAVEAAMNGIHGIGFSLCEYDHDADMTEAQSIVREVLTRVTANLPEQTMCLNVNIPYHQDEPVKGLKWCRQAKAAWVESFDKRETPFGRHYYWLTGEFVVKDDQEGTDLWAIDNNYASVVPVQYDLTDHDIVGFDDYK